MDFKPSPEVETLRERVLDFMDEHVYPQEREIMEAMDAEVAPGVPYSANLVAVRERAKAEGLWNLFMPDRDYGPGLANWEYGLLCEEMGRSPVAAAMAFNCSAPDTGNMEILAEHGTEEQKQRWLEPLLEGQIRSCFSMTEPEVSGSDPTLLQATGVLEGGEWVIDGHKWFTSGAVGAELAIAMVVTDPDAPPYARASMICVPTDNPGFELVRPIPVMGHTAGPGHCEIRYEGCRVPAANLLGERGAGFAIAQDRLGPGRIHHCMRAIGTAERAHEMMCRRANERVAFGGPLADKQFVQEAIATSRMEIDQARLLTLYAAWKMDTEGKRAARQSISAIKIVAANMVMEVLDRAIQIHGSLGMTDDTPLAALWRFSRMLRLADGPDEVHKMVLARRELNRWAKRDEAARAGSWSPGTRHGWSSRSSLADDRGPGVQAGCLLRGPREDRAFFGIHVINGDQDVDPAGGRVLTRVHLGVAFAVTQVEFEGLAGAEIDVIVIVVVLGRDHGDDRVCDRSRRLDFVVFAERVTGTGERQAPEAEDRLFRRAFVQRGEDVHDLFGFRRFGGTRETCRWCRGSGQHRSASRLGPWLR